MRMAHYKGDVSIHCATEQKVVVETFTEYYNSQQSERVRYFVSEVHVRPNSKLASCIMHA